MLPAPASHVIDGQSSRDGGVCSIGPEPSRWMCAWRVAAQFGIIAIGREAACVGWSMILTSTTVVSPPSPWAPMPSAFTRSKISRRSSSIRLDGPRSASSWMSTGSIRERLASTAAFSAVPPMPMPSMPGGHQPAPIVGTVLTTQSTIESDGFSIASLDLFSEPPPLAAISISTVSPSTSSMWMTAGVLSPVFFRAPAGSARIDARSTLSGVRVGAPDALVDHRRDVHAGLRLPAHVHADAHERRHDAGVLADRAMAFGAHARVDEDLRHRVLGGLGLLALPGGVHRVDVVLRVVVGHELEGVGDALDQVVLADGAHALSSADRGRTG